MYTPNSAKKQLYNPNSNICSTRETTPTTVITIINSNLTKGGYFVFKIMSKIP